MAGRVREVGNPKQPSLLSEDPDTIEDEPKLAVFLDYWRQAHGDRGLPLWSDFKPRDVKAHLGWVIVVDALENLLDFRYRLVGSRVCDYFLGNGTGKTVREAFAATGGQFIDDVLALYRHACVSRIPLRLQGKAAMHNGAYFPAYDSLDLPYSSNGVDADRIVCVFTFNYKTFLQRRQTAALLRA